MKKLFTFIACGFQVVSIARNAYCIVTLTPGRTFVILISYVAFKGCWDFFKFFFLFGTLPPSYSCSTYSMYMLLWKGQAEKVAFTSLLTFTLHLFQKIFMITKNQNEDKTFGQKISHWHFLLIFYYDTAQCALVRYPTLWQRFQRFFLMDIMNHNHNNENEQ